MSEILVPDSDVAAGGWTTQAGGTTNLFQGIDETGTVNTADYVQSALSPVDDTYEFTFSNPSAILTSGVINLQIGKKNNNSVVVNLKFQLWMQTATPVLIREQTFSDIPFTPALQQVTLTAPEIAAITDATLLRGKLIANPTTTTWEPSALGSKLGLAYDPWKAGDLFQVSNGTVPVTTLNDPIGCLKELYDAGPSLVMPTAGSRPLWHPTNGIICNELAYLRTYDGGSFTFGTTAILGAGCRLSFDSDIGFGRRAVDIWAEGVGGDTGIALMRYSSIAPPSSTPGIDCYHHTAFTLSGLNLAAATLVNAFSEFDGTNHTMYKDNVAQTPVTLTGNIGTTLHLSYGAGVVAGSLGSSPWKGALRRLVITKGAVLTSGERASLNTWLSGP